MGNLYEELFEKSEHLDESQISRIKKMYTSDPSKHSVRSIAQELNIGRSQVARVVRGLGDRYKTKEQVNNKQSEHARWKGKKLPKHIVSANHEGRNKQIAERPQSTLEGPVSRALRAMGVSFKSQVSVEKLLNIDDPEAGIVDFFIPGGGKGRVLECQGPRHKGYANIEARDKKKRARLTAAGYKFLEIFPKDMNNLKERLRELLK